MSFWRAVNAIVWKDVATGCRARVLAGTMFVVSVMAFVVGSLVVQAATNNANVAIAATLWTTVALSGLVSLRRSFTLEVDRGSLDGLLLGPVSRRAVYVAKWLSNWVFVSPIAVFALPIPSLLGGPSLMRLDVLLVMILGAGGYAALGTLHSAVASNTRTRGMLLPLLLLPVALPLLLATVTALDELLSGGSLRQVRHWLGILIGYSLISVVLGWLLFDCVVEG